MHAWQRSRRSNSYTGESKQMLANGANLSQNVPRSEMDQSKKTMRHFYCRDVLWETFEQMANDFDCSIDYLINEAMRYYARSKNYQSAQATGGEFRGST